VGLLRIQEDRLIGSDQYQVFVNATMDGSDDRNWGVPFVLPFPEANTNQLAVSSIIAFTDNSGPKVGVMWSNELTNQFYFASRPVSNLAANTGWTLENGPTGLHVDYPSNGHINLKKNSQGQLFAAIKTHADLTGLPTDPLVMLVARDKNGVFSNHIVSPVESLDTRPIAVVFEGGAGPADDKVYVFMTSNPIGGAVCYQAASITSPLSSMVFPGRSCGDPGLAGAEQVLADNRVYVNIDNATTSKQILTNTTDIVILATDQDKEFYTHAVVVNPLPLITSRTPTGDELYTLDNMKVRVTFSQPMNTATINTNTVKMFVNNGPQVTGTVVYTSSNRTLTFTPSQPLAIDTRYRVVLTQGIQAMNGQPLLDSPVEWTFKLVPLTIFLPQLTQ
jgi:hypothetical protein